MLKPQEHLHVMLNYTLTFSNLPGISRQLKPNNSNYAEQLIQIQYDIYDFYSLPHNFLYEYTIATSKLF